MPLAPVAAQHKCSAIIGCSAIHMRKRDPKSAIASASGQQTPAAFLLGRFRSSEPVVPDEPPRKVDRQFQLGFRHKGGNVLAAERTAHFEVANRSRRLPHTLNMQRATRRPGPVYCQVGHK